MNTTLKTLLTTAEILSMSSVFAADAERLGGASQPELGMTTAATATDPSREDTFNEQINAARDFVLYNKIDEAAEIYKAVAQHPESTPNHKYFAAAGLKELGHTDAALAICIAIAADPAAPYEKLYTAGLLCDLGHTDEATTIYTKIANNPASTVDQKLNIALILKNLGCTDDAAAIYNAVAADSATPTYDKLHAAYWLSVIGRHDKSAAICRAIITNPKSGVYEKAEANAALSRLASQAN